MNPPRAGLPHAERLKTFETMFTCGLMLVLMFCLSVFVISLPVKAMLLLTLGCLFLNHEKTFSRRVWPLLAMPLYGAAVSYFFPCWHPDLWTILERPLFSVLCVLMVSVVLSGKPILRYWLLAFGILFVCLVGAIGDSLGYDMTALLPFTMPDDAYFQQVTMDKFGAARVRGFFPESGVLGAVSLGLAVVIALGAWVMLSSRRRAGIMLVWLTATVLAVAMLGLTLTKSGLFMLAAGLAGFIAVLALGRNAACKRTALGGALALLLLFGGLVCAPGDLGAYFRTEIGYALSLSSQSGHAGGTGMATRIECWKVAIYSVRYFPLGVGSWGVDNVLHQATAIVPTPEMRYFFNQDMFGLKNALANLISQTGLVGAVLLGGWVWCGFLNPAFRLLKHRTRTATLLAGLYGASAALSVMFLFSCELYPSYALLLFFQLHAEAVAARVCVPLLEAAESPAAAIPLSAEVIL